MEDEDSAISSGREDAKQIPEEVPLPLPNENDINNSTEMGSENCTNVSSSQTTTPQSPEEMDRSDSPNVVEVPLPCQCDDLKSGNESTNMESKSCTIIPSNEGEDITACPVEVLPVPLHNVNRNLDMESEIFTITPVSQDTTPCSVKVSAPVPNQFNDNNNLSMESEDCAVTVSSHDTTSSPVQVSLPNQDEGVSELMTPASPSHLRTVSLANDDFTNASSQSSGNTLSKAGQRVKKGLKRKSPSAHKGIQTSFHLDSNSTFRDRIVDLDNLRRETGVVCVEDLQDLDVALDEWPMLLVSQLRLRDTIINNLNGVICELVECGQVLEQDMDYLRLKNLELQQETKRRPKEDQQSHKNQGKETESQTTEEDFTEAWSRWYYGRWGDYYSESDPTSSLYWPGHYMQQTTVASKGGGDEEMQQKAVEKEQERDTGKLHEGMNSEKDRVKKKSKEKNSSHAESDMKSSDKRKKLKGKRKERHKSEKSSKEQMSVEKEDRKPQDADKRMKKKKKEKDKRREEGNGKSQIIDSPLSTQQSQEDITSTTSTTKLNGTEKEGKTLGWDISQSITQQVETAAAQAVVDSGYIFQEELGLYYDYNTGYYYNAENGLYYDTKSGTYFYYDHTTQSYQFHSQVSPTTTNNNNKRRKRKTAKKESTKSSSKNEDTEEREEGECTDSDDEGKEKDDEDGESEEEEGEEGDTTSSKHHEEEASGGGDIPPSLRLMVVEGGERVRVGELHVVTLNGGTVGREATNDVHLPDLNVSKVHAEIEYHSTGADDHHYFLRDLGSNNGTFVNSVRLSEARQASKQVEVGHGWEVQFGPIKVKCHLHPGNLTCNECEPGLVLHTLPSGTLKPGEAITSFKNAKSKEKARRKELKAMQKKYKLTHRDPQPSSTPAIGYTDRTLLRQAEKGSDNPYEKTEVASSELPLKETNRGFALLQKMGWSQGQGLGKANSGITEPVQPLSVVRQAGLGSSQPSALPPPDPWGERRRKQLQITQERYKQSTVGH